MKLFLCQGLYRLKRCDARAWGVNMDNVKIVADAGLDYLVVGSGLFDAKNVKERFVKLSEEIKND